MNVLIITFNKITPTIEIPPGFVFNENVSQLFSSFGILYLS